MSQQVLDSDLAKTISKYDDLGAKIQSSHCFEVHDVPTSFVQQFMKKIQKVGEKNRETLFKLPLRNAYLPSI